MKGEKMSRNHNKPLAGMSLLIVVLLLAACSSASPATAQAPTCAAT